MVWKDTPNTCTMRGFKEIDDFNKTHHPIKFFFKETLPDMCHNFKDSYFIDTYWWFMHRFHPKHRYHIIDTHLGYGYHDTPVLMLYAVFSLLVSYIEEEKCFEVIVWDDDETYICVASELDDLYWWWKNERPKREDIEKELFSKVSDHFLGESNTEDSKIYTELSRLEVKWMAEDIYNMKRLVSIKDFMWT